MGTKRLSDAVNEIVEAAAAGEIVNTRQAVVSAWDDVDDDGQYLAGIEGMSARVNSRARSLGIATAQRRADSQPQLPFNLPAVVAVDAEQSTLLATRGLSRDQFIRAIDIREKQIRDDRARLAEWKTALKAADKFWRRHPDWSFGQCLDAIMGVEA